MLTPCSLLDGILWLHDLFVSMYMSRTVSFFPPLLTSTYTTTKCKWGFERNQLQNECKYKKVVPTPPFCAKRPLAGILYCSPSPPLYVAKIWRRIYIYGFNFTHPTVYPLQTPGNLDIIPLSFLYLFECPWLPQSAGCLFWSQDAQSALDQIASGVHVLRTRLTGCPQQATGLTAVIIYT